jgi:CheY-like chemotaxis protein
MARILVIEDNPSNMALMVYLLKAFGHMTDEAEGGEAGLAAARREPPDLVLCDLQMPGMDGFEVARQLKADPALCAVPVVAVTAYAMVGDREKVLAAGFNGYITKPISPERFVEQVETFLPPEPRSGASHTDNTAG